MSKTSVHPYPTDQQPLPGPKALTANAANDLRLLLQQAEGERERVAAKRADMWLRIEQARAECERFVAAMHEEIDSTDTILAELDGTADRYRQRLGSQATLDTSQGDRVVHSATWNGNGAPETGSIAAVDPFADNQPDGHCIRCGQPVWRVPASPTNPRGATHSFGATCDPDSPDSEVADLGEQAVAS
ncbi:hypothetical protein [Acrocarpospora sp. B8E8]|uniref:hypothetical protein n=1 Tax=Acrocarpospora sp. B8E8 TaxID=3153572 RepID=UPI00325C4580